MNHFPVIADLCYVHGILGSPGGGGGQTCIAGRFKQLYGEKQFHRQKQCRPSSETQGQVKGARESLNGRESI